MSAAFERARAALLGMWERSEGTEDEHRSTVDMLVVADALEEANLLKDAEWLRLSFELGYGPEPERGACVFIGHTIEDVRRAMPPSPNVQKKERP